MSIDTITAASAGTTLTGNVVGGGLSSGPAKAVDPKARTLDKQAFLNLLVTQLRNQDPSSPMDSNALIAQTTQMASVESLTALATTSRESFALQMRAAAAALVGRDVSYSDQADTVRGLVTGVSYAGAVPSVTVGGKEVPLDSILSVTAAAASGSAGAAGAA